MKSLILTKAANYLSKTVKKYYISKCITLENNYFNLFPFVKEEFSAAVIVFSCHVVLQKSFSYANFVFKKHF